MENPGKWKDLGYEHLPEIVYRRDNRKKYINVMVPLEQRPDHYIESIILLDHNHNEIGKKEFQRICALGNANAEFYPGEEKISSRYYVISKCNIHDMWEQNISLDETKTK